MPAPTGGYRCLSPKVTGLSRSFKAAVPQHNPRNEADYLTGKKETLPVIPDVGMASGRAEWDGLAFHVPTVYVPLRP